MLLKRREVQISLVDMYKENERKAVGFDETNKYIMYIVKFIANFRLTSSNTGIANT